MTNNINNIDNEVLELIKSLRGEIDSLKNQLNDKPSTIPQTANTLDDEIVIVFGMINSTLRAEFPTWKLSLSEYGQRYAMKRYQFQELLNNHRSYFKKQYIFLAKGYEDIAAESDCVKIFDNDASDIIHKEDIKKFGDMSERELENYYDNLSDPMKKIFISYFLNQCNEHNPKFFVSSKMNLANKLIGGRLFDNLISSAVLQEMQNNKK